MKLRNWNRKLNMKRPYPKPPAKYNIDGLRYIMRELLTPETGCAWDLEQNFASVGEYTIEEAYEVVDAINRNDYTDLADELGDLLLHTVFHSQMAENRDLFDFDKVIENICDKMVRRHPHVFADVDGNVTELTDGDWQRIKDEEKRDKPINDSYFLDKVGYASALVHSQTLQEKAASVGFDWPETEQVKDKITEELDEFYTEVEAENKQKQSQEFGDLLFSLVNYGRHLGIDCDAALQATNDKFIGRFNHIEDQLRRQNKHFTDADLNELEALWQDAKGKI